MTLKEFRELTANEDENTELLFSDLYGIIFQIKKVRILNSNMIKKITILSDKEYDKAILISKY